ncbi:MAG: S49 family peptidase [Rickettsiaceae bacterium]
MGKNNKLSVVVAEKRENIKTISKIQQFCSSFIPSKFKNKPVVAVIRLNGAIGNVGQFKQGELSIESMNELIEKAFKLPNLNFVCLSINSPGGSPVQSELIANRIIMLSKEKKIPVYSFVEDVAASGGYWLACAAKKIYASKSSIIGSIGVVSSGFGFQDAIKKFGIERRVHTVGKNKSVLDPFSPLKEDDVKIVKKIQTQIYQHFVDYVKSRRVGRLTQDDDILFNGEFWSGESAVDFGLIDGIDNMYNFIYEEFGNNVKIEYIGHKKSWIKKKFGITHNISIDPESIKSLSKSIREDLIDNRFNIH